MVPSTNACMSDRNGRPVGVMISVEPAFTLIAAAPMITQNSGFMSTASTRRKKIR